MFSMEQQNWFEIGSVKDLKAYATSRGSHFFDAGAMRFFNSRVLSKIARPSLGEIVFVTSERHKGYSRRYTLRVANADGTVHTLDGTEFQQFTSANHAWAKFAEVSRD